jgi:hypothetical protein
MSNKISAFVQVDVVTQSDSLTVGHFNWAFICPDKNTTANKIVPFAQVDVVPQGLTL